MRALPQHGRAAPGAELDGQGGQAGGREEHSEERVRGRPHRGQDSHGTGVRRGDERRRGDSPLRERDEEEEAAEQPSDDRGRGRPRGTPVQRMGVHQRPVTRKGDHEEDPLLSFKRALRASTDFSLFR